MPRRPSAEERALWRNAMRDVVPAPESVPVPQSEAKSAAAPVPVRREKPAPAPAVGLDRRSAQRLKRGQTAIEARLDLHGMIQDEAHPALTRFIAESHAAGRRAVLVITGKGTREGAGVLRRAVPRWLAEAQCRPYVLAIESAQPRHGGDGAFYVLLRRFKS
jgi:DNA-nicking Smr family endonuclease